MQQVCHAARFYQHPMHIKTANTKSKCKCIIMGHNDPVRVIYRLGFFPDTPCVDSVYPGLDRGCSEKLLLLALQLVLVVKWSPQYIVYGRFGFERCGRAGCNYVCCRRIFRPRSTSLTYLLKCPTLISLSTRNFKLRHLLVSCP